VSDPLRSEVPPFCPELIVQWGISELAKLTDGTFELKAK